ncbi:WbqC family protein [Candidatus Methylospira mobilis]|uniref:WbqC family protein n=1 Tax=Candidatus Methylospira mobilis TaxID=1808979 RepID=A0A5Q0BBV6_9GAMM|nr:WbqC family protein [Candidatus Methylospira mobilis]QFY41405.1 WbqC family protein [Candidatus Methylospira mobilis]
MRVGVIQSSFIPWRGYFDFIASVDTFVFHDDIQYTKGDWRNRNKIKTVKGTEWLTVPVRYNKTAQSISDTEIDCATAWGKKHIRLWQAHYRQAPYLRDVLALLDGLDHCQERTISQLNLKLTGRICEYLAIATPSLLSSELSLTGSKTDRLIDLLQKLNATTYLSGPNADAYLDKEAFRKHGIGLEYKSYDYTPYPQLWGAFEGGVTVLDLIANCGPDAKNHICSHTPNQTVVEKLS